MSEPNVVTELIVHTIHAKDGNVVISASPHWSLLDISDADEVRELTIENARFQDEILHPERELMLGEYDIASGNVELWDDQDGNNYVIQGKLRVKQRWYTKEELLTFIERMTIMYTHETEQCRRLATIINETQKLVVESYRRSEIRLSAGKQVHILRILEHIKQKLNG